MRVAYFGTTPEEESYIKATANDMGLREEVSFFPNALTKENMPGDRDFDAISIFVDSRVDAEVFEAFPKVRYIMARSVGYDHVDIEEAQKRGITVSNIPSYGDHTVAEFTFALILALSRKIFLSFDRIRETGSFSLEGLRGFDLAGKTLGVVGTGKIGKKVIELAQAFALHTLAYDMFPDEAYQAKHQFTYVPLETLLRESDIVSLHVPYSNQTHHLINRTTLSQMKKGAYLINTSRGGVVETEALVESLKSGHLAGAGLDVLEEELVIKDELDFIAKGNVAEHNIKTILANHILINLPNVVITPHNAFNTREALLRILDESVRSIKLFIDGTPINVIR